MPSFGHLLLHSMTVHSPKQMISVPIRFFSYFREAMGAAEWIEEVPEGTPLGRLIDTLSDRSPEFARLRKCALTAVGVEYQDREYPLQAGDEVSLFPPVQGG